MPVLAHGGAVGAAFEAAFLIIPIGVFAVLSRIARKRAEEAEAAEEAEVADEPDPETTLP